MAGGYPCCCLPGGSTLPGSSQDGGFPLPGSSGGGGSADIIVRGSSYAGTASCINFEDAISPAVLRVEVNGIANKNCDECSLLNGVYFVPASIVTHPTRCGWELSFPPVCGHYSVIYVELFAESTGFYTWGVLLSDRPFVEGQELLTISAEQTTSGLIAIADVNNVFLSTAGELNATRCTSLAGATAIISAVT